MASTAGEEPVRGDEQGVGLIALKSREGRLDFAAGAGVEHSNLQPEAACSFWHVPQNDLGDRSIGRIDKHGDTNCVGYQLMQQAQPLGQSLLDEIVDAGHIAARPGKA